FLGKRTLPWSTTPIGTPLPAWSFSRLGGSAPYHSEILSSPTPSDAAPRRAPPIGSRPKLSGSSATTENGGGAAAGPGAAEAEGAAEAGGGGDALGVARGGAGGVTGSGAGPPQATRTSRAAMGGCLFKVAVSPRSG